MNKLIYTSYSPNTRAKDLRLNIGLILSPWRWKNGPCIESVKKWFSGKFPNATIFTFNYARSALYVLFKSLNLKQNEEIILQGFTCVAAVNPIIWAGARPVFVDINPDTFCMDIEELRGKISPKTKAILYQYTFGFSGEIDAVRKIAQEKKILLIEDCANTIGGKVNGQLMGSIGDAAVFSLGRDKVVSGVDGGVLVVNNKALVPEVEKLNESLDLPSNKWIFSELCFPVIWWKFKKTYAIGLSKIIHLWATKLGLLTRATTKEEKKGKMPEGIIAKLPNSLACLAVAQLKDLDAINKHRNEISDYYKQNLVLDQVKTFKVPDGVVLLRYPIYVEDRDDLKVYLKSKGIMVGDWYDAPVAPVEVSQNAVGYEYGTCVVSEMACENIMNLPTHINISFDDAKRIIDEISNFYGKE